MKTKIICEVGVFDLLTEARSPGVVIAESESHGVLLRFAGDYSTVTMRAKKYRVQIPRDRVGPLLMRFLDE